MTASLHTRRGAMDAILNHVNIWQANALEQSRADYIEDHGPWPDTYKDENGDFFPDAAPSIPQMNDDDPTDIQFIEGKLYRRLTIFSGPVNPLQYVGGNSGGEPRHTASLEWSVLCPPAEQENLKSTFDGGLKEIADILTPLTETGLTDPDSGDSAAISFLLEGADFQTHDIGNYILRSCIIDLSFTLFANSILA